MADLFKEKAQDWDANDMVKGISMGVGSAIQDNVVLDNSMHVMDFGAGTGLVTQHLADKVGKVIAVDVSAAMLEKLTAKDEFKDFKVLWFHTHARGLFHMREDGIKTVADLKGKKVRAPNRYIGAALKEAGASPVFMPVPALPTSSPAR